MGGKGVSLIHRVVDFPKGYFFRLAFQNGAPVRTPQRADESGFLKCDQKSSNHDGVCIHRLGQTRRGTAIVLLQCQDRHHMHRKNKSTAGHAMNVTNLITFSKGYQKRGREARCLILQSFNPSIFNRARYRPRARAPRRPIVLVVVLGLEPAPFQIFLNPPQSKPDGEDDNERPSTSTITSTIVEVKTHPGTVFSGFLRCDGWCRRRSSGPGRSRRGRR
jgi:hypothetical protein